MVSDREVVSELAVSAPQVASEPDRRYCLLKAKTKSMCLIVSTCLYSIVVFWTVLGLGWGFWTCSKEVSDSDELHRGQGLRHLETLKLPRPRLSNGEGAAVLSF